MSNKFDIILKEIQQNLNTLKEKTTFFEEVINNNFILFFQHDYNYECCTLQRTEKGVRLDKCGKLNELLCF